VRDGPEDPRRRRRFRATASSSVHLRFDAWVLVLELLGGFLLRVVLVLSSETIGRV
jgi:hypothetical protein